MPTKAESEVKRVKRLISRPVARSVSFVDIIDAITMVWQEANSSRSSTLSEVLAESLNSNKKTLDQSSSSRRTGRSGTAEELASVCTEWGTPRIRDKDSLISKVVDGVLGTR